VNFFYLANGLRERIEFHDGYYSVLNSTLRFSRAELEQEVASYPERFSPNVMLRPLYQEVILPNLAYIGGGAEVVYWLQLKQLFNTYHVDFPALILRNSALLLSNEDERILREYALTVSDLFLPEDELVKRWVMKHTAHDLSVQQERATFTGIFRQLENRVSAIDPTLGPSSAAIAARLHHALDNLERKLVSAEKRNQTGKLKKLIELRHKLFPGNSLQERKDNIGSYYAKYGSGIIEALLQHLDPLDFKFTVLTLGST
jgi:bacillithiol biosynthesis cysteine-adding enzyme BshC